MSLLTTHRALLSLLTALLLGWGVAGAEAQALPPMPKPPADPGGQPTFQAPPSLAHGDQLDEWCKGKTTAINFAVCSDDELRKLALERLRAFNEANARLSPDQQKILTADQNGWALSYPQACGFATAEPPALPLAPSIKECLADAGRKRLSYLRSYGLVGAAETPPATAGMTASPPAASAPQAQAQVPPPDTGSRDKSSSPAIHIPSAQQNPAGVSAAPSGSTPAQPDAKPATSEKSPANDKPSTWSAIPGTAKIAALLIAAMVVGMWLGSGLRRWRRPNRDNRPSPTA